MSRLDLTSVQAQGEIKDGEYIATCKKAELRDTKAGTGKFLNVLFKLDNGETLFHKFNIENPNDQAVKIGLAQLKSFLLASGWSNTQLADINLDQLHAFEGLSCTVRVKVKADEFYGPQPNITVFKAAKKEASAAPTAPGNIF